MKLVRQIVSVSMLVFAAMPAHALARDAAKNPAGTTGATTTVKRDPQASRKAFAGIANVLRDPRCMNCHTVTEFPRQADDRHRHHQLVMRGPNDKGISPMLCASCHQAKNSADGKVPGAPHWQLAPLSMGWEHLKTDKALCETLVDQRKNGGRDVQKLVTHMVEDPLVQWAWDPGERKPPAISQDEFHTLVRLWASTGAVCPK